jgi:hypothetical protein
MASKKFPLLAALLLSACSGSLIDHLGIDLGQGQLPDGGDICNGTVDSCGINTCRVCTAQKAGDTVQCESNVFTSTSPSGCDFPNFTCSSGCCPANSIAAGGSTTCAVAGDSVRCWGVLPGSGGNLSRVPTVVGEIPSPLQVAVSADHACAVSTDGTVRCWGSNEFGQLGLPASPTPVAAPSTSVPGITDATHVEVGTRHTCAFSTSQGILCWGENDVGQLSDGTANASGFTVVPNGAASGGSFTAGLLGNCGEFGSSGVSCWGSNARGQIGNGASPASTASIAHPTAVTFKGGGGSPTITGLASGESHSCAIANATISCWGAGTSGQIGDGSKTDNPLPQRVDLFAPRFLAAGGQHTCATSLGGIPVNGDDDTITRQAGLYCWGDNTFGQLGSSTNISTPTPPAGPVSLSGTVAQLAAGTAHTCALLTDHSLYCWGNNGKGQIGEGTATGTFTSPTKVTTNAP